MKRLLAIIFLAAALAAAPAAGQTIKSLGYNTTNGQVVYSGSNSLTFTNALQFSTNARAATRTNLGATTVGDAVFSATNAAAAASAVGLGETNDVTFKNITISDQTLTLSHGAEDNVIVRNESGSLELESPVTIKAFSPISFNNTTNAATTRTNLGLGGTNTVTFADVTAQIVDAGEFRSSAYNFELYFEGGNVFAQNGNSIFTWTSTNASFPVPVSFSTNVTVTGNATLNGVANLAPAQTASSGDSLMTLGLVETAGLRAFNRFAMYESYNFTTAMLTAIGGSASPSNFTGSANDVPAWAFRPNNTVDGATNNQALLGPFLTLSKGSRTVKNWSKRNVFAARIQHPTASAGTSRIYFGPQASTWAGGDLSVRGIGFEIVNSSLFAVCHNGTNKTTSASGIALTAAHIFSILLESDGAGGVRFFVDGVEQTPLTGGPTGNSGTSQYGVVVEAVNPTPAASTIISIQAIQLIAEL